MKTNYKTNDKHIEYEPVGEFVSMFQRGRRWYAYFRFDGKTHRPSLKTTSKKEARLRALAIERDLVNGQVTRPKKPPSINSVISDYLASAEARGRSQKTLAKYRHCYKLVMNLAEQRHKTRIDQIDLAFVDAYRAARTSNRQTKKRKPGDPPPPAKRASAKTIHNDVVLIKQLVNFAVCRKMIRENPLANLKLNLPKRTPQPCWTRDEVESILAAAKDQDRPLFQFLADTGTRIGEAIWLTWDDVDFDHRVVHIRPKDCWQPKSGDQRSVPVSDELLRMLTELPQTHRWVFTAATSGRHQAAGRQISERTSLGLKRVLKKLGLPGHLHTFRHSFISHALTSGEPEAIVREWVGHVDPEIIRVYTHIASSISRGAMDGLLPASGNSEPAEKESGGEPKRAQNVHREQN